MSQYLQEIKTLVDNIAAAGSTVDTEDIILYILNGLPAAYQAFKTSIRTMIQPISLDNLYSLLLSEEINVAMESARHTTPSDPNLALYTYRGRGRRGRGRTSSGNNSQPRSSSSITCQICNKRGHAAAAC
ncbi:uncharacterized protein LOC110106395 [Dendrobium catenatum]|uniref:uncharacterized protein LOC110106395 n=1 Tax=Dendrobium catenatum TaxID=906689 RepID=UPI0009F5441D|nr:uncharacterized protein LOC110106395 [Dendrobium catenatum]